MTSLDLILMFIFTVQVFNVTTAFCFLFWSTGTIYLPYIKLQQNELFLDRRYTISYQSNKCYFQFSKFIKCLKEVHYFQLNLAHKNDVDID